MWGAAPDASPAHFGHNTFVFNDAAAATVRASTAGHGGQRLQAGSPGLQGEPHTGGKTELRRELPMSASL